MATFTEMAPVVVIAHQLGEDGGPVILVNTLTVPAGDAERLMNAWASDAALMKQQPGFVPTQKHRGIGGSDEDTRDTVPERIRCRHLVGADRTKGTVRKSIGLDLETASFEGRAARQIDAKLSWQRTTQPDQLWFFLYHNGFPGVLPVRGGYHRLFFLGDEAGMPDRDPTRQEMQDQALR